MTDVLKTLAAEYIGSLPSADWKLGAFGNIVIAIHPEHPPRIVKDEEMYILDLGRKTGE